MRVKVSADLRKAVKASKPDIAVLCTSSSLKSVMPQLEELLKQRLPVVSTTEELAYPRLLNRRLAKRLDELAKKAKVAVLGTGVNPGFRDGRVAHRDDAVCEYVEAHRSAPRPGRAKAAPVVPAEDRRRPHREQFKQQVAAGAVRHVGFAESIQMIADAIGWTLPALPTMCGRGLRRKRSERVARRRPGISWPASARKGSATSATTRRYACSSRPISARPSRSTRC